MKIMILDRLLNEEPARDGYERVGRLIGSVIGISMMLALAWVALRG